MQMAMSCATLATDHRVPSRADVCVQNISSPFVDRVGSILAVVKESAKAARNVEA